MDREETKKIIRVICASYPNYKPTDLSETIDIWTTMLAEYSYEHIAVALKTYIATDTSGFAPSIGQLVNSIKSITEKENLTEMQAWTLVDKAIRNGLYGAEKEFENLPPEVQKAVGSPSQLRQWALTDQDSIQTVAQSNFMRSYRAVVEREKYVARIPESVKQLMNNNLGGYLNG